MAWVSNFPLETGQKAVDPPVAAHRHYRAKIDTAGAIRREIAKLYRLTRNGELSVDHFSKLTNALYVLGRMTIEADVEARLERLERAAS